MKKTTLKNIIKTMGLFILMPIYAFATTGTMLITSNTVLTEDHFGTIAIEANGVTLNCGNFKVIGAGRGHGVKIVKRKNVVVTKCNTRRFAIGFSVLDSDGIRFTSNSSSRNTSTMGGFVIKRSSNITLSVNSSHNNIGRGFLISKSTGVSISHGFASRNGSSGIEVFKGLGFMVQYNKVKSNKDMGVLVRRSSNFTVKKNEVSHSTYHGISITASYSGRVARNDVHNNKSFGIYAGGTANVKINRNKSFGNGHFDMSDLACPNPTSSWNSNLFNTASCPNIN